MAESRLSDALLAVPRNLKGEFSIQLQDIIIYKINNIKMHSFKLGAAFD